jgi:DNA-binding CsgD family transcriptional regulator
MEPAYYTQLLARAAERDAEVLARRRAGMALKDLARELCVSVQRVQQLLDRAQRREQQQ